MNASTATAPSTTTTPIAAFANTPAQGRREERLERVAHYRRVTSLPSARGCMNAPLGFHSRDVSVYRTRFANNKVRASAGVQTCKGDMCPGCANIKNARREADLSLAMAEWIASGGEVIYCVFGATVKKSKTPPFLNVENIVRASAEYIAATPKGMPAKQVRIIRDKMIADYRAVHSEADSHDAWEPNLRFDAVSKAQAAVFTTGSFAREKKQYGVVATVKSIEEDIKTARFPNGARNYNYTSVNIHMNAVMFIDKPLSDADLLVWKTKMTKRWIKSMAKSGYVATETAQYWNAADSTESIEKIARYILKQAKEFVYGRHDQDVPSDSVTRAQVLNEARGGVISDQGVQLGPNASALNWYRNYEQVKRGRNAFMKSHHFYEATGVADQIAERDALLRESMIRELIAQFSNDSWGTLTKGKGKLPQVMNLIENTDGEQTYVALDELDVEYNRPEAFTIAPMKDTDEVPLDGEGTATRAQ
jgi:hypothetical protein